MRAHALAVAAVIVLAGCGSSGSDDGPDAASIASCLEAAGATVDQVDSASGTTVSATFPGNQAVSEIVVTSDGEVGSSIPNPTTLPQSDDVHDCLPPG